MNHSFVVKKQPFNGCFFDLIKPLLKLPHSMLLDSGDGFGRLGRYSFLGVEPFRILKTNLVPDGPDPLNELNSVLVEYALPAQRGGLPFLGGAMGYLSYDLGRAFERLPETTHRKDDFPEILLGLFDKVIAFDHEEKSLALCVSDPQKKGEAHLRRSLDHLQYLLETAKPCPTERFAARELKSDFTRQGYQEAVEQVLRYIETGDIYQANLSQAFEFKWSGSALELYQRLRQISPAPFAAFLNLGERWVLSNSPERFLRLQGSTIETRPIKGTRPRGTTPVEDGRLADELKISAKDRAELLMIVDLERNDLGRVARFGSVTVDEMAIVESYANVHHLVATVTAQIRPEQRAVDLIRAAFPGGSITGAPKIRAMEIIEELEPRRRSLYTGALGYIGFDGNMDLNITIRSILLSGENGVFQVGGGIVADSNPALEYEETLHKAGKIIQALGL